MSNAIHKKKYWGWYQNQQSEDYFDELSKDASSEYIFYHKVCDKYHKIKDLLHNQRAQDNWDYSGEKNKYKYKKNHTQVYDLF